MIAPWLWLHSQCTFRRFFPGDEPVGVVPARDARRGTLARLRFSLLCSGVLQ